MAYRLEFDISANEQRLHCSFRVVWATSSVKVSLNMHRADSDLHAQSINCAFALHSNIQ